MLVDSLIVPQCLYRPGSFTGLMTLYESNYLKLERLLAELSLTKKAVWTSTTPKDCDLHLEVMRKEPYTSTLRMTYWFDETVGKYGERVPDPDLTIRVYHDARLAEAVAARVVHRHPMFQDLDPAHAAELDRRWRLNMMLNKWLDYVSDMGHGFS